jgi:uncharacterized RDD family membrane protein YckC
MQTLPPGWIIPDPIPLRPAPGYEYAGFWRRFWAYLIDTLILGIPLWLLELSVLGNSFSSFFSINAFRFDPNTGRYVANPELFTAMIAAVKSAELIFVLGYVVQILYFAICWWRLGASLGQKLLGVEVRNEQTGTWIGFWRGCLRAFGYLISGFILDIGFIWAAFDPRKQGWHDKIAGTVVVRRSGQDSRAGPFVVILVVVGLLVASCVGLGAFVGSLPRTGLNGSFPVPTLLPTRSFPASTGTSGMAQAGSSSQPTPTDIWIGTSYDRTTFSLTGRSSAFPRAKPLVLVASLFRVFHSEEYVTVHLVAAGIDRVIDLFTFSVDGNILGDILPATALANPGTVHVLVLDAGGITMASGIFTVQ